MRIFYRLISWMKKWFTLIEILVVLVIVGMLMSGTMIFGANRIEHLRHQSAKTQFMNSYENLQSFALSSNYFVTERFDTMIIKLQSWSQNIQYQYVNWKWQSPRYKEQIDKSMFLSDLQIWNNERKSPADEILLNIAPYQLWCDISSPDMSGSLAKFQIRIERRLKNYCFGIGEDTCRLIEEKCEKEY